MGTLAGMRLAVVALVVAFAGCGDQPAAPADGMPPDADLSGLCAPDPGLFSRAQCESDYGSDYCGRFCVQPAYKCSAEGEFCAGAFGECRAGACRLFCRESSCPVGEHRDIGPDASGKQICVCVPD